VLQAAAGLDAFEEGAVTLEGRAPGDVTLIVVGVVRNREEGANYLLWDL